MQYKTKSRVVYKPAAGEFRQLLCQVSPATFIASLVKICWGDDVHQVPQTSTFHKSPATQKLKENTEESDCFYQRVKSLL